MGARPLKRSIQRYVEDPLADFVLGYTLTPNGRILVDHKAGSDELEVVFVPAEITADDVTSAPPVGELELEASVAAEAAAEDGREGVEVAESEVEG